VSAKLSPVHAQFTPSSALAGVDANAFTPPALTDPPALLVVVVVVLPVVVCFTAASFLQPTMTNAVATANKVNFLITDIRFCETDRTELKETNCEVGKR
jgi:hypothetical protein